MAKKCIAILAILIAGMHAAHAQRYDTVSIFSAPIQLDSVVVRSGFDVKAFVRRVKNDTTFYKAFKSLLLVPYTADNTFTAFDKHGRPEATLHTLVKQDIPRTACRITHTLQQQQTGDFVGRDGSYNYFTADLFKRAFFTDKEVCNQTDIIGNEGIARAEGGRLEKNKYELKQLIFNPGSKVEGVPLMGDKASVFDKGQEYKYNFRIVQDTLNGVECLVFRISPKPEYAADVVFNQLDTWFRKADFSIVARDYSLSFHTLVYNFDVQMKVRTAEYLGKLYPVSIDYNGTWHVLMKKREHLKVHMDIVLNANAGK